MNDELKQEITQWADQILTVIKSPTGLIELCGLSVSPEHGVIFLFYYDDGGHLQTVFARDCARANGEKVPSVYDKLDRLVHSQAERIREFEQEKAELVEATKHLLFLFDRALPSDSIGKRACNEARELIEKVNK